MCKYPMYNIYIDYDGIQCGCYLSKSKIKKAVFNYIYGALNPEYRKDLLKYNVKINVYWFYEREEPVVYIPSFLDDTGECIGDLIGLGKYLDWRY